MLPVHPLRGRRLFLVRTLRAEDGQQYVDVEHPERRFSRMGARRQRQRRDYGFLAMDQRPTFESRCPLSASALLNPRSGWIRWNASWASRTRASATSSGRGRRTSAQRCLPHSTDVFASPISAIGEARQLPRPRPRQPRPSIVQQERERRAIAWAVRSVGRRGSQFRQSRASHAASWKLRGGEQPVFCSKAQCLQLLEIETCRRPWSRFRGREPAVRVVKVGFRGAAPGAAWRGGLRADVHFLTEPSWTGGKMQLHCAPWRLF
jgi:hypothetical protein